MLFLNKFIRNALKYRLTYINRYYNVQKKKKKNVFENGEQNTIVYLRNVQPTGRDYRREK